MTPKTSACTWILTAKSGHTLVVCLKSISPFGYRIAEEQIREKGWIVTKIHKSGFQADEAFKVLMREVTTRPQSKDSEQFLKNMVALVLK